MVVSSGMSGGRTHRSPCDRSPVVSRGGTAELAQQGLTEPQLLINSHPSCSWLEVIQSLTAGGRQLWALWGRSCDEEASRADYRDAGGRQQDLALDQLICDLHTEVGISQREDGNDAVGHFTPRGGWRGSQPHRHARSSRQLPRSAPRRLVPRRSPRSTQGCGADGLMYGYFPQPCQRMRS